MRGMRFEAVWWLACSVLLTSPWRPKSRDVRFGGAGLGGHGVVCELMVRVRLDRNISMLEIYSRALRPALSIKLAARATAKSRTIPTMAAS